MLNKINAIQKGLETIYTTTPDQTAAYLEKQRQQQLDREQQQREQEQQSRFAASTAGRSSSNSDRLASSNGTSSSELTVHEGGSAYPGISRSPSPFLPEETDLDNSAPFENLKSPPDALNVAGLCDLKIS